MELVLFLSYHVKFIFLPLLILLTFITGRRDDP